MPRLPLFPDLFACLACSIFHLCTLGPPGPHRFSRFCFLAYPLVVFSYASSAFLSLKNPLHLGPLRSLFAVLALLVPCRWWKPWYILYTALLFISSLASLIFFWGPLCVPLCMDSPTLFLNSLGVRPTR